MREDCITRASRPSDSEALARIYSAAFPAEDLWPLVSELLVENDGVLSVVATIDDIPAGHIIFTNCCVSGHAARVALLGPLAVLPAHQRQGIGATLIREGLKRLEAAGVIRVFVLGDPAYYSRFGFMPDPSVVTPCPIPIEWQSAWQSRGLGSDTRKLEGTLVVPAPWQRPALWAP